MNRTYRFRGLLVLALFAVSTVFAASVQREDLSEAARQFLPEKNMVDVRTKDGRTLRAELVRETETGYDVRVTTGTITSRRTIARADVVSVEAVPVSEYFAAGLKDFKLDAQRSLPPARYQQALRLFDEYLDRFPDTEEAAAITETRDQFLEEYRNIDRGLQKVGGEWLSPVRAAVRLFDQVSRAMADLESRHPGITQEQWDRDPTARRQYDGWRDQRRDIARQVPRTMTERVPLLIDEQRYDEAFVEMNAFLRFWIARVLESEAAATDRARFGRGVFEGMDFDYLLRLQRRVMEPYMASRAAAKEPAPAGIPDGMVYIPGGYFFMGNEQASPTDDNFPFRVVFVNPFLIDRHEVSNAEYREFVEYVRRTGDYSMSHPSAPPLKDHSPEGWNHPGLDGDRQPVVGVDWFDAYAYLQWRGKRLPTEAEWELAARGRDGRPYPWGDAAPGQQWVSSPAGRRHVAGQMDEQVPPPPPQRQSSGFSCRRQPPPPPDANKTVLPATTWPVDAWLPVEAIEEPYDWEHVDKATLNPFGLLHMAGNAAEWVADWYDARYYPRIDWQNPKGPGAGSGRVFRGGSYLSDDAELRTFQRGQPANDNMIRGLSSEGRPMIGIRGARDLPLAGGN